LDWTLGFLEEPARELFVRLGAFAAPVELDEIEAVAGSDDLNVLDALSGLLDVSLVRRVESGDSRIRFGLPEALRQMASEMLDGSDDAARWRDAHLVRQHQLLRAARIPELAPDEAYHAAVAADLESAAALRWARLVGHPLAAPVAVARAGLLATRGRLREALALCEFVLSSTPEDAEVLGEAHLSRARVLGAQGRSDEALEEAATALSLITKPRSQVWALIRRGLEHAIAGHSDPALVEHERATAIARELGGVVLARALYFESQARMGNCELEVAAEMLAESDRVTALAELSTDGHPNHLPQWRLRQHRETLNGDLAVYRRQPADALEHYARSLELAQQEGQQIQMYNDLIGMSDALALTSRDADALEIAGIAEALAAELGIESTPGWHVQGVDNTEEAASRVGGRRAEELRARGRAVTAANRVARASTLVRPR
jgi:tetratricopeptide (TPR) repeat protein